MISYLSLTPFSAEKPASSIFIGWPLSLALFQDPKAAKSKLLTHQTIYFLSLTFDCVGAAVKNNHSRAERLSLPAVVQRCRLQLALLSKQIDQDALGHVGVQVGDEELSRVTAAASSSQRGSFSRG